MPMRSSATPLVVTNRNRRHGLTRPTGDLRGGLAGLEGGEGLLGEGALLGLADVDIFQVEAVDGDAYAPGGLVTLFADHLLQPVESVAAGAEASDHPGGHLGDFGHGALHFQVADASFERFDLLTGDGDRHIAGADELLIGGLGLLHLFAVFLKLALDGLQAQRILTGGLTIAQLQVRGGLGVELVVFGLQLADLGDEPLDKRCMGSEAAVELADLLAQVLLLELEQSLGVLALEARDEQANEAIEKIAQAAKHAVVSPFRRFNLPRDGTASVANVPPLPASQQIGHDLCLRRRTDLSQIQLDSVALE